MQRNRMTIIMRLLSLTKGLVPVIIIAITAGVFGFVCAQSIPILGTYAILGHAGYALCMKNKIIIVFICTAAVLRGVFHYVEQYANHFTAFTLLARMRDIVFGKLRVLCPAKLDVKGKGDLVSLITSDIELIEVFYAHTISPFFIALIMSVATAFFIGNYHWILGLTAAASYTFVGICIPLIISKRNGTAAEEYRKENGSLNSYVLENLYGLDEIIQYGTGEKQRSKLRKRTERLLEKDKRLKRNAGTDTALIALAVSTLPVLMLAVAVILYAKSLICFNAVVMVTVSLVSSFGPVIALANLGCGLEQTFAAANRILDIIDETPQTSDVHGKNDIVFKDVSVSNVCFSYGRNRILDSVSLDIANKKIIGIAGKSGSGKSTLLKLVMRFYDCGSGTITFDGTDIRMVNTKSLRDAESYMTQDTVLFHDTIANNIRIANLDATQEQIEEACRKASVHDFIKTLPHGYETKINEMGNSLSGGERQRLALARAFVHRSPFILLDEPTSNLDTLNEAVILKSLKEKCGGKTIIIVSHRKSTLTIADSVYEMKSGRLS